MKNHGEQTRIIAALLVIFQTTSKFIIVFVRLISRKVEFDGFTRS